MAQAVRTPLPEGFRYLPDFLSPDEECALVDRIDWLTFGRLEMHGMVANRRVVHFDWQFGYESWSLSPSPPVPDWILPLRERVAALLGTPATRIEELLISRYDPAQASAGIRMRRCSIPMWWAYPSLGPVGSDFGAGGGTP